MTRDPYRELPQRRLRWRDLAGSFAARLLRDGERTLSDEADLLPEFDKLVHPVGIALRGVWHITEETPYSGYFRKDSMALMIARASDAVGEYRAGKLRFMGIAGKLWPTLDEQRPAKTANFFTLENLGGTHTRHFAHAAFANDLLPFVPHPGMVGKGPIGAVAATAFMLADRTLDATQAAIRQVYPIAELGNVGSLRAPRFLRLVGDAANPRCDSPDLRLEIAQAIQPSGLRYRIEIADESSRLLPHKWQAIGSVVFTEAVASHGADHRLHFTHPKYR
ncbi:MAG: hypothetical protein ABW352_04330 [Polyangiales bacterium]